MVKGMCKCSRLGVAGLLLSCGAGAALAQASAGSAASSLDKAFLREATEGSNFEIQLAQLALKKSSTDDVKQFAHMMITDHTRLNEQMKPVAADAGVTPPTGVSKKDKALYAKLQGLNGELFDQAYIRDMVQDHSEDLKAFQNEAHNGQLPSETKAAAAGAQVVSTHLAAAKQLAQAHRVS